MYIYPWEKQPFIIPFPGQKPSDEVEPWVRRPQARPPFVPLVPIKDDDEYPISKDDAENFNKEQKEAEQKAVMKGARKVLNKDLKTSKRKFELSELCLQGYAHLTSFMVYHIIKEYTAAGWKVIQTSARTGINEDTDYLEFS